MPQYNAELKDFFEQPLKDAGYPGLNRICKLSGIEQNQLLPTLSKKTCRLYLIMGKCMWKNECKFKTIPQQRRRRTQSSKSSNALKTTNWDAKVRKIGNVKK